MAMENIDRRDANMAVFIAKKHGAHDEQKLTVMLNLKRT
jgi:hypothetical protein